MTAPAVKLWWRYSTSSVRYLCVHAASLHEALGIKDHGFRAGEHWTWDRARRWLHGLPLYKAHNLLVELDRQADRLNPKKPAKVEPAKRFKVEPPKSAAWLSHAALAPEFASPPWPIWHDGKLWVSARDIWSHLKPAYHFKDWVIYRTRQNMKYERGGLFARPFKRESTGGRPADDYLMTPAQALALADMEGRKCPEALRAWFNGLALLHGLLESGSADLGPAVAALAGALVVKDAYSVKELAALLSGRPGFPVGERRWREHIACREWPQAENPGSRAALYRVDAETLAALRTALAEAIVNG
jgi:hypothetical protein